MYLNLQPRSAMRTNLFFTRNLDFYFSRYYLMGNNGKKGGRPCKSITCALTARVISRWESTSYLKPGT
jgi:hypothetical protein